MDDKVNLTLLEFVNEGQLIMTVNHVLGLSNVTNHGNITVTTGTLRLYHSTMAHTGVFQPTSTIQFYGNHTFSVNSIILPGRGVHFMGNCDVYGVFGPTSYYHDSLATVRFRRAYNGDLHLNGSATLHLYVGANIRNWYLGVFNFYVRSL